MKIDFIALSVPIFFLLIFVEIIYGNYKKEKYYRLNDTLTNLSCGIGQTVLGLWLKFYFIFLMAFFYQYRLFTIPNTWYFGILLFLGVDLCYYWFHRLSHEINAIWATHVVHHQSEEYNLSVALRQSWFQSLFSAAFYIPLPFLGFHPAMIATIVAFNTLYQFWIHTKTIKKMPKIIEWVFNTPSHHRVHHGTNPKYIDKNHAGSLIIWDRIFGTFQEEEEEVVYGITTPLRSWNPIWANFHYWRDIGKVSIQSKSMINKILAFIKMPGWQPKELGGRLFAPSINQAYQKYNPPVPRSTSIYLIIQYVVIVGITSYFMFFGKPIVDDQTNPPSVIRTVYIAIYIILAITSVGLLLENKPFSLFVEYFRIACLAAMGWFFLNESYGLYAFAISLVLGLVSFIHFTILVLTKPKNLPVET
jgi:sterol desaturase/sphingolipid hydroxylase (fatty acid hydroxylase superfamily)